MSSVFDLFLASGSTAKLFTTILLSFILLALLNRYLRKYWEKRKFQFQFLMLCLTIVVIVVIIIVLPLSDALRGQLLSLFGILLSAAIAFASTTFIGNILAGVMLRVIKNIKLGDYITVDNITGRTTEMNLLHVEVQTEQSDLVTIPNIHMVTFPVKVVRSSGTIVSIDLSLGYDISRHQVSKQLCLAAEDAGLSEGFVQIRNLGDFSITYRIAGRLEDTSNLLSVRANLYNSVLDRLHGDNIEIVSPSFMNTRAIKEQPIIPTSHTVEAEANDNKLETLAFEKAEMASSVANVETAIEQLTLELEQGKDSLSNEGRKAIEKKLEVLNAQLNEEQERLKTQDVKND
ncbi:mechanosensitive ion channel domain-containing protein [uncultured Paraglaciecola sp.]|uniref:mechanosensitive ion channel family protein n=1 Tax=uncultured Paraglaciecola sp. TaxID=1765024 RepID=UPI0030DC2FFA|tara:strand:+ start:133223 stop:134260 length:1038 start_codon:yes stop_codon:yes gene_type:complete